MPTTPSGVRCLVLAMVVTALALVGLGACSSGGDGESAPTSSPAPSASGTPLSEFSTKGLVVARTSFCASVAPTAVADAVGTSDYKGATYDNGDRARLTTDVKDVAHEYGCSWQASDGTVARAWVFAPPVTRAQARSLARSSVHPGCSGTKKDAGYGNPSVATFCKASGGGNGQGYYGLFGDAWLSCTLGVEGGKQPPDLTERASRWCVAVASAASS